VTLAIFLEVALLTGHSTEGKIHVGRCAPDIVILDLNMPSMNGIDAAKRIRQISRSTAIVFLTGYTDADIKQLALEFGHLWLEAQMSTLSCYQLSKRLKPLLHRSEKNLAHSVLPLDRVRARIA